MKRVVRLCCYLLVIASILSACTNKDELEAKLRKDESNNATNVIKDSITDNNYERFDLLMERYINETKIYGTSVSNGIYDKVQLQIAGQTKDFEWSSLADDNYLPQIFYVDVNKDEVNECVVILTDDLGNNYISEKCHIIDKDTLDEINIYDVKKYLDENIRYEKKDDTYDVCLNDEILFSVECDKILDAETNEEKDIKDVINYKDEITYHISSDEIYANVIFRAFDEKVYDINLSYEFLEDEMKIK